MPQPQSQPSWHVTLFIVKHWQRPLKKDLLNNQDQLFTPSLIYAFFELVKEASFKLQQKSILQMLKGYNKKVVQSISISLRAKWKVLKSISIPLNNHYGAGCHGLMDEVLDSGDRGHGFDSQPRRSGFGVFFILLSLSLSQWLEVTLETGDLLQER